MMAVERYMLIEDGEAQGVILWDGETPFDPCEGCELVREDKYAGPPPATVEPEPIPDERRIATLEAQIEALTAAPDFATAKVDVAAVKDSRAAGFEVGARPPTRADGSR